jgi:hypothetical protein
MALEYPRQLRQNWVSSVSLPPNAITNASHQVFDVLVPEGIAAGQFFDCELGEAKERFRVQVPSNLQGGQLMRVQVGPSLAERNQQGMIPSANNQHFDVAIPQGMVAGQFFDCELGEARTRFRVQVPPNLQGGQLMRVRAEPPSIPTVTHFDAGLLINSTSEIRPTLDPGDAGPASSAGDSRRALLSFTFRELGHLVKKLAAALDLADGARMPTHVVAALFKGEKGRLGGLKFRPQEHPDFRPHFSPGAPTVAITYTWSMCLLREMPQFIARFEQVIARAAITLRAGDSVAIAHRAGDQVAIALRAGDRGDRALSGDPAGMEHYGAAITATAR